MDISKKKLSEVTVEEFAKYLQDKGLFGIQRGVGKLEKWSDNVSTFIETIYKDVQEIKRKV